MKNSIESVIGLQLACCVEWNIHNSKGRFNGPKLARFINRYSLEWFKANEAYFAGFMNYIEHEFWEKVEEMAALVPQQHTEFTLRSCADIICISKQENDIRILKLIQHLLVMDENRSNQIVQEVVKDYEAKEKMEQLIGIWGKNSFQEP